MLVSIFYVGVALCLPVALFVLLGVNCLPNWMSSRWAVGVATGVALVGSNLYLL